MIASTLPCRDGSELPLVGGVLQIAFRSDSVPVRVGDVVFHSDVPWALPVACIVKALFVIHNRTTRDPQIWATVERIYDGDRDVVTDLDKLRLSPEGT